MALGLELEWKPELAPHVAMGTSACRGWCCGTRYSDEPDGPGLRLEREHELAPVTSFATVGSTG